MNQSSSDSTEDIAADWLARRHFGLSADESRELAVWLAEDPGRREVFARLDLAWQALNQPRAVGNGEVAVAELVRRRRRRNRRRWAATAVAVTGLAAVVIIAWPQAREAPLVAAVPPTAIAHPDLRHLPDGSVAELNAGAEFTWNFTPAERDVHLTRGEALFSVAHDTAHPFVVVAGGVRVRAVGTAFNVRLGADAVEVLVTEGKVQVDLTRGSGAAAPIAVAAGEKARIPLGPNAIRPEVVAVREGEVRQALAWRSCRVEFSRAPLAQAVDVFNRRNALRLVVGDASIRDLQISGIYWSDDPEGFARLLHEGLDLRAERESGAIVLRGR